MEELVVPKIRVSKSGRRRLDVPDLIARLEEGLQQRQAQLERETLRNLYHKRRLSLLTAVACASAVLNQVLASDDVDAAWSEAERQLITLEIEARALVGMLQPQARPPAPRAHSGSGGSAAGGEASASSGSIGTSEPRSKQQQRHAGAGANKDRGGEGHVGPSQHRRRRGPPPRGEALQQGAPAAATFSAVGMTPCEMIRELARLKGYQTTLTAFAAEWTGLVRNMAILLHQRSRGAPVQDRMLRLLREMGMRFACVLLHQPSVGFALLGRDFETGAARTPSPADCGRAAAAMALNREQAAAFSVLHEFWEAASASMQKERQELAQKALNAPQSFDLQQSTVRSLERVQRSHVTMSVAVTVLTLSTLLTTQQAAEYFVQMYPHVPALVSFLGSINQTYGGDQATEGGSQ